MNDSEFAVVSAAGVTFTFAESAVPPAIETLQVRKGVVRRRIPYFLHVQNFHGHAVFRVHMATQEKREDKEASKGICFHSMIVVRIKIVATIPLHAQVKFLRFLYSNSVFALEAVTSEGSQTKPRFCFAVRR